MIMLKLFNCYSLVVIDSYAYTISFYPISAKGEKADGVYQVLTGSEPTVTWMIEDPDYASGEYPDGQWWQESSQSVFSRDNADYETTTSVTRTKLTGLGSGGLISATQTTDIFGNVTPDAGGL